MRTNDLKLHWNHWPQRPRGRSQVEAGNHIGLFTWVILTRWSALSIMAGDLGPSLPDRSDHQSGIIWIWGSVRAAGNMRVPFVRKAKRQQLWLEQLAVAAFWICVWHLILLVNILYRNWPDDPCGERSTKDDVDVTSKATAWWSSSESMSPTLAQRQHSVGSATCFSHRVFL